MFPHFNTDFQVVDDLQQAALIPARSEVASQAVATSPDLRAARVGIQQSAYEVDIARYGFLPSLGLDFFYGIDASQFAARTYYPVETGKGEIPYRQNLGYVAQATLNIPVWNWGATRSKIRQAELKRDQAQLDLTLAQRTLEANLTVAYAEAQLAQAQLASLKSSADLAAESLRLTVLRYQAGEAVALEVVDAQNTLALTRNALDDGWARSRVALATLQLLTGNL
jgi:outer membrane protein TolC